MEEDDEGDEGGESGEEDGGRGNTMIEAINYAVCTTIIKFACVAVV